MYGECTKVRFDGQHIYVGIDVPKRSWKICIYVGRVYQKRFSQNPDPNLLVQHLHKNFPGAVYHTVYEAGCFGFWIHRALTRAGVHSMVIHPADVPRTSSVR